MKTIFIVKSSFDWITQNLVSLWNFWEMIIRSLMILLSEFGMPSKNLFFVALSNFLFVRISFDGKNFVIIFDHFFKLCLYFYNLFCETSIFDICSFKLSFLIFKRYQIFQKKRKKGRKNLWKMRKIFEI